MVIGMGKERHVGLLGFVKGQHPPEIEIDQRVSVEHEKFLVEIRQRINQSTGCAARGCLFDTTDAHAELTSVAEVFAHDIGAMMNEQDDVGDAIIFQEPDGALEQRNAEHGRHGLGNIHPKRFGEARSFAASQNDGLHQRFSATISETANLTASGEVICAPQPSLRNLAVE